ncbi:MAG: tRNA threonylcarbamoyladenosine dehydratase [Solobacterium sp.]|nr:tRNA threonylcarbamoyladenosine dehydratase [Solobacterium sp.]
MNERTMRLEALLGADALEKLRNSRVAVFGIGGVGASAVEALARSGVGHLDLVDSDKVVLTNLNRQLIALQDTLGMYKVDAAKQRVLSINPDCIVHTYPCFYLPSEKEHFPFEEWDYIVDAIDTVTAKLDLISEAQARGIPIISSMGTGNRIDPSLLRVKDIYETKGDPLARIMRHECRKRNIPSLTVVCSEEEPLPLQFDLIELEGGKRRSIPASSPFVPPAAGFLIASRVIMDLTGIRSHKAA